MKKSAKKPKDAKKTVNLKDLEAKGAADVKGGEATDKDHKRREVKFL